MLPRLYFCLVLFQLNLITSLVALLHCCFLFLALWCVPCFIITSSDCLLLGFSVCDFSCAVSETLLGSTQAVLSLCTVLCPFCAVYAEGCDTDPLAIQRAKCQAWLAGGCNPVNPPLDTHMHVQTNSEQTSIKHDSIGRSQDGQTLSAPLRCWDS